MNCIICSKRANFTHLNIPVCGKICQYELIQGKREREEEPVIFDYVLYQTLLRAEVKDLKDLELISRMHYHIINSQIFLNEYMKENGVSDEFVWFVMSTKSPELISYVKERYNGIFTSKKKRTPNEWLERVCKRQRTDLVEQMFNYNAIFSPFTIRYCIKAYAIPNYNLKMFQVLFSKITPDSGFCDSVLDTIKSFPDPDMFPTVKIMFDLIYPYVSDDYLNRVLFYFLPYDEILTMIYKRIKVREEHLIDIIFDINQDDKILYLTKILEFGMPDSLEEAKRAALTTENGQVLRFLNKI